MRKLFLLVFLLASTLALGQQPVNVSNVAGAAVNTGNGTASGSMRVVIASDNTAFPVNATLSAETTKVIGTINVASGQKIDIADASGNAFTSNSTTYTAKFGLDVNLLGTLGTAFSTAGKIDIKGADGDVFVRNATAANFNATVVQATGSNLHVTCDSGCSASSTIQLVPGTSGGTTASHLLAAATNNATSLKASAGQLYGASVYNNAGYPVFLKFYNKASAPAPASDTVVFELAVQAGTQREFHTEQGVVFGTGIAYALVKGISDTDNTSVAASDATVDLIYK